MHQQPLGRESARVGEDEACVLVGDGGEDPRRELGVGSVVGGSEHRPDRVVGGPRDLALDEVNAESGVGELLVRAERGAGLLVQAAGHR